jgi:MFS family permease
VPAPSSETPTHGFAAYRRVLAAPHVAPMALASVIARLPSGMGAVALVLYVQGATGSFADAGIVAGAFTIGLGITGPLLGRIVDRRGPRLVLLPGALIASAGMVAVVALGHADAGPVPLAIAAGISGAATPVVSGVMRQRWPALVPAHDLPTTFAVDAIMVEVLFIAGPLLAGILAATVGAGDGLLFAAVVGSLGTAWFVTLVGVAPAPPSHHPSHKRGWAGPLTSPAMRLLVFTGIPLGATFGSLDVALPAFGALHGHSALGGPFAASLAVGSAFGGIFYGARPHSFGAPARALLVLGVLLALTTAPILLAATIPEMFIAATLSGVFVAPLVTVRNQLAQESMPPGTGTEAFTWLGLSLTLGASAGAAVAGPLVEAGGWRAGAVLACAVPVVGVALVLANRSALPGNGRIPEPATNG